MGMCENLFVGVASKGSRFFSSLTYISKNSKLKFFSQFTRRIFTLCGHLK